MSNNPAKYEVLIKQYLRSILDISGDLCFGLALARRFTLIASLSTQGWVVPEPFSANPGFNVNRSIYSIIFCVVLDCSNSELKNNQNKRKTSPKSYKSKFKIFTCPGLAQSILSNPAPLPRGFQIADFEDRCGGGGGGWAWWYHAGCIIIGKGSGLGSQLNKMTRISGVYLTEQVKCPQRTRLG